MAELYGDKLGLVREEGIRAARIPYLVFWRRGNELLAAFIFSAVYKARKAMTAFRPPNAKELESAAPTRSGRAVLGT